MAMRGRFLALCAAGAFVFFATAGTADARGAAAAGGFGGGGGRGGGFVGSHGRGFIGGRIGGFGGHAHRGPHSFRQGHRHWGYHHHQRFGHRNRLGGFYGGLPYAYGSYGGYGYGTGGYDPDAGRNLSQPTVGIPPSPVLPPAIYVIGDRSGRAVGRQGGGVRKGSIMRKERAGSAIAADSRETSFGSTTIVKGRSADRRHRMN